MLSLFVLVEVVVAGIVVAVNVNVVVLALFAIQN